MDFGILSISSLGIDRIIKWHNSEITFSDGLFSGIMLHRNLLSLSPRRYCFCYCLSSFLSGFHDTNKALRLVKTIEIFVFITIVSKPRMHVSLFSRKIARRQYSVGIITMINKKLEKKIPRYYLAQTFS